MAWSGGSFNQQGSGSPVILFDFDYTLGDSTTGIVECVQYAFERCNLPLPLEDAVRSTIGLSLHDMFAVLAPGYPPAELAQLFIQRADVVMVDATHLYEDVPGVVLSLRERAYQLGIVSTKFRSRIAAILDRSGLLGFFDVIVGGEDVARPKPDPEGIKRAMAALRCNPARVTYVGDSTVDAQTAAAAGVRFFGVSTGTTSAAELRAHGAAAVVGRLAALVPALSDAIDGHVYGSIEGSIGRAGDPAVGAM